jgi:hypothetical protein
MALHRDIFWVGRQWAVTGYGIQACNQKQRSKFDIEASRLWESGVLDGLRAESWINRDDLDQAVAVARKHFPQPDARAVPPQHGVVRPEPPSVNDAPADAIPAVPMKPAHQEFALHIHGWPARFVRPWRIRIRQ